MASTAAPAAGAPEQEPAAGPGCDLDPLWDAWVGCIVNSQCFRDAEASGTPGKAALKSCAKPESMSPACAAMHKTWTDCKFGIVQNALDQSPDGFSNPQNVSDFALEMMDFALKMMDFVIKMMNF